MYDRYGSADRRPHHPIWLLAAVAVLIAAFVDQCRGGAIAQEIQAGVGPIATIESLNLLIALERAKDRGVDYELILRRNSRSRRSSAARPISASARPTR